MLLVAIHMLGGGRLQPAPAFHDPRVSGDREFAPPAVCDWIEGRGRTLVEAAGIQ